MSDIYRRLSDARRLVSPEDQDYDIKTAPQPLKSVESLNSKAPQRILRIYTDGSSLVSKSDSETPSFSGWGYFITGFQNGSQKNLRENNGFILDGTPLLAELQAIKNGLEFVNRPTCVSLVTDSTDAIKELKGIRDAKDRLNELRSGEIKTSSDRIQLRVLQTLADIDKIVQSKNITALEVSWQPSHTMDKADVSMEDVRVAMESESDFDKRMFLLDVYGNEKADKRAGKGSKKAVEISIQDIQRQEARLKSKGMMSLSADFLDRDKEMKPEDIIKSHGKTSFDTLMKYTKGLRKCAKLFHGSRRAKEVAIDLLGKQDPGYFSGQSLDILFNQYDQNRILERKHVGNDNGHRVKPRMQKVAEKLEKNTHSEATCLKSNTKPYEWAKEREVVDNSVPNKSKRFDQTNVKID